MGEKIHPIRVIFLDIDGVLNSLRSFLAFKPVNREDDLELETLATCDPVSVKLVNMIIEKTGAKVVVSSSHRTYFHGSHTKVDRGFDMPALQRYIADLGVIGEVIDATPLNSGHRGESIKEWLEQVFPHKFPQYALERYVILDDGTDMLPEQLPHFVQTTFEGGMTVDNYTRALGILSRDPT